MSISPLGWRRDLSEDEQGYFHCPICNTRKPATLVTQKIYVTLFFLTICPLTSLESFYRCESCNHLFEIDTKWPYDFGSHPAPKRWDCRFCTTLNPNHVDRCTVCGADA